MSVRCRLVLGSGVLVDLGDVWCGTYHTRYITCVLQVYYMCRNRPVYRYTVWLITVAVVWSVGTLYWVVGYRTRKPDNKTIIPSGNNPSVTWLDVDGCCYASYILIPVTIKCYQYKHRGMSWSFCYAFRACHACALGAPCPGRLYLPAYCTCLLYVLQMTLHLCLFRFIIAANAVHSKNREYNNINITNIPS